MSKLHPIKHDLKSTLWCGPAALSITTGQPTSVIHRVISKRTGKPRVKGVTNYALCTAAQDLGFRLEEIFDAREDSRYYELVPSTCNPGTMIKWPMKKRFPTLAAFLREHRKEVNAAPIIINVTRHYVVVHGRTFVDNQNPQGTTLKKAPGRRRRVFRAWRVVPMNQKQITNGGAA